MQTCQGRGKHKPWTRIPTTGNMVGAVVPSHEGRLGHFYRIRAPLTSLDALVLFVSRSVARVSTRTNIFATARGYCVMATAGCSSS